MKEVVYVHLTKRICVCNCIYNIHVHVHDLHQLVSLAEDQCVKASLVSQLYISRPHMLCEGPKPRTCTCTCIYIYMLNTSRQFSGIELPPQVELLLQCNPLNSLLRGVNKFFQIAGFMNYQEPKFK